MTRSAPWREVVREAAYRAAHAEGLIHAPSGFNYRWEHVRAVVALAHWLAAETGADVEVVEAAAWLHDVAKSQPNHARAGAEQAARILAGTDFPPAKVNAVVDAIAQHEGLTLDAPLSPLPAAVLWDADKLTKMGATGHLHMRAVGFLLGATTEATADDENRWLNEVAARIAASMSTAPARAEANRRLEAMRTWHAALLRELHLGRKEI